MDKELIDVAVLTPGVYAEALRRSEESRAAPPYQYLATVGLDAATSKLMREQMLPPPEVL